jgi:hypothetical protein
MNDVNEEADVPRKRGRPKKNFRPPILSAAQVLDIKGITPEEAEAGKARKEVERQRGIARRAAAKIQESLSQAETVQQYWQESRKLMDPQQLVEWRRRQDHVGLLLDDIRVAMSGVPPGGSSLDEWVSDVAEEITEDLAEFGECAITPILLAGPFWLEPTLLEKITRGDTPSSIFGKTGLMTALPDIRIHQWNEFLQRRKAPPPPLPVLYKQSPAPLAMHRQPRSTLLQRRLGRRPGVTFA